MPADAARPLLNPVLRFTKEPSPKRVTGGGKNANAIQGFRLGTQRTRLAREFRAMAATAPDAPRFNGRVVLYAAMFDDSLAPSYTPKDFLSPERGARLLAPFRSGYLVEVETAWLPRVAAAAEAADRIVDMVDLSRIQSVRFFDETDTSGLRNLDEAWAAAPKLRGGRAFLAWFMPLHDDEAAEALLDRLEALRDGIIEAPPNLLADLKVDLSDAPALLQRGVRIAAGQDRFSMALRAYRQVKRAVTTLVVPTRAALTQLAASGTVYRLEPVAPIASTAPGEGVEPNRPLPQTMAALPIVGVVDGGLTAASYATAEAWRAPPFVANGLADSAHGNRVTSLVVQGHDWNNNLVLPPLYCQIGIVQAVPRKDAGVLLDPQAFLTYLDLIMAAYPNTKVWNFSMNQPVACDPEAVSYLGHGIAMLARKHDVLPVISVGNKPGALLQPPADCEAALTVGGRTHDDDGTVAGACPVSLTGPGPSSMLKPDLSHFSNVRVLGGLLTQGSSFATALTSPLAAHTAQRLRDPKPDLVKGLLLHRADGLGHDTAFGFGAPGPTLPWDCAPGYVTLQWTARLRPGAAYYWELPIPPALRKTGKLRGEGKLTAVLNPHPMVTEIGGPNYFSARVETALQLQRGGKNHNLLGGLETGQATEAEARAQDHKWSPVRQHARAFQGVSFDGETLKVYARTYVRDLYLYGLSAIEEVPAMEVVFILTLSSGNAADDIYNEVRDQLGAFVETSVIQIDAEIDT